MDLKIIYILLIVFLQSCETKTDNIAEKTISREIIHDRLITQTQKKLLTPQIDSVFSKYQFNGSVAVLKEDEILYRKEQGFEDFAQKKKLDRNSVFAIASLSKQFTAVLILLNEEENKLSIEDQVSKYLPLFQTKQLENITIKQLLKHSSGISDSGNGLLSKPGEKFHYSNKGYRFLGEIIEKVSGKSYDENVNDLFQKAGIKNSFTANLFKGIHFAGAYIGNSKNYQQVSNMPKRLAAKEISIPAGGILSTVSDLHRWNKKLYGAEILDQKSLKKFLEKSSESTHPVFGKMNYGLGIMMGENSPQCYFHSGYVKGAPSLMVYYPNTKTSLIILSNIAEETKGKNAIFNPHKDIKQITDAVQNLIIERED
jgi:CubicO group peptidase (beta-lactamase class C family)